MLRSTSLGADKGKHKGEARVLVFRSDSLSLAGPPQGQLDEDASVVDPSQVILPEDTVIRPEQQVQREPYEFVSIDHYREHS